MAGPENLRRGILPIRAPQRERTAPVLPRPRTEPVPASPEPGKPPKTRRKLSTKARIALAGLAALGAGVGAYEVYDNIPAVHQAVDSAFLDHLKGTSLSTEVSVFDNSAAKGVISERNTIQMTREEYAKIAPPTIDRTDRKEVLIKLNIPPGSDGRTIRELTLEQGTAVNAMIYVKTPDGTIRDVTYTKVTHPGEAIGVYPTSVLFPGCTKYLGNENEIQAGDIFPAPISGRVYYYGEKVTHRKGEKLEDGSIGPLGGYIIEGEYYDEKGSKFLVNASITTFGITKPVIKNIPDQYDDAFKEKAKGINSSGTEVEILIVNKDKIPVVMVQQGEDFFKFVTKPPVSYFSSVSTIKSQVQVNTSYHGDIGENGIPNRFAGENCVNPTLDNKAIVLK